MEGVAAGLVTYRVDGVACEIVTLDGLREGIGIGATLTAAVSAAARTAGWCRTPARWMRRAGAVDAARRLKPQIPLIGLDGIPIHDEIALARVV